MNFGNLLQQAQQMQRKVNKAKKEFDEREFEFNSQDDLIVGKMKGNLSIIELHIAPSLMQEDQDNMEALLMATINQTIAKVSIVGAGMDTNSGVASDLFESLYSSAINVNMISTSEIKISVLVDEKDAERAANAIHDKFVN